MEWTQMKSDWTKVRPKIHTKWDKLTESDLTQIGGKRDELVRKLEQRYSFDHKKAETAADEFVKTLRV